MLATTSAVTLAIASAKYFGGEPELEEPWLIEYCSKLEVKPKVTKKIGEMTTYRFDSLTSTMDVADFY